MENLRPSYDLRDQLLKFPGVFPAGDGTAYSAVFDLESIGQRGVRIDNFELAVESPALTATQSPAGSSLAYSIQFSDTEDFSGTVKEWTAGAAWAQVGSADGAEPFAERFRVATTESLRYVRVKCVAAGGAAAGDAGFLLCIVT